MEQAISKEKKEPLFFLEKRIRIPMSSYFTSVTEHLHVRLRMEYV